MCENQIKVQQQGVQQAQIKKCSHFCGSKGYFSAFSHQKPYVSLACYFITGHKI